MKWANFPLFQQCLILIGGTSKVEKIAGLVHALSTANPQIFCHKMGKMGIVENYVESVGKP